MTHPKVLQIFGPYQGIHGSFPLRAFIFFFTKFGSVWRKSRNMKHALRIELASFSMQAEHVNRKFMWQS